MENNKVEEKEDEGDGEEKEGKNEDSIYSRFTKRRRTSLRENKPISTPQRKRRRCSPSAISSDDESDESNYAPSEYLDERPSRSQRHRTALEPSLDCYNSLPEPEVETAAKDMKYLWPLQGFLECTTRGNERSYALNFTLTSTCQHLSHVEPHNSEPVGSSDGALATNLS